jgi:YD repeat-containing protein
MMTHTYDAANRLQQSVDQDGLLTSYDWDTMNRLITTTVGSQVSRVYGYNQRGHLLQADVDGLLTTFAYDGDGNRLLMSVAGVVTIYTL